MTKIAQTNVDGINYAVSGASLTGICSSPASDFMKLVTLTDSDSIEDGVTIACTFTHENSAGTAPSSLTLYSTDQIHFYTDAGMTELYTLAPSGCFELTYTGSGNAYSYVSYPVVAVGTLSGIVSAPVCDSHGKVTSRSLWKAGDVVFLQYKSRKFFVMNDGSGNSTAGVAFKGTRSAYNTAKLIPEGSDGHIPSGALVIITDEGKTYITNGTGSSQTLELVANATFNGTHAEWNALTLAQKAMYDIVNFTDDEAVGLTISDVVQDGNMNPVTSNAVADAISIKPVEEKCGTYFGAQMYHKSYLFNNLNITANETLVLDNNFDLPYNCITGSRAFLVGNNVAWSNDVKIYVLSNGTLAIKSSLNGNNISAVLEFYYIKNL